MMMMMMMIIIIIIIIIIIRLLGAWPESGNTIHVAQQWGG
jgi:hypothetical protein